MGERTAHVVAGDIGETLTSLATTIRERRCASVEDSYTARLFANPDKALGKVAEEAAEVIMAAKDEDHDHLRYEAGDLLYHLLVVLDLHEVGLDELAGELNARMR
jgi:phosphoribosyl-ATP pyrophosphohydrolase